MWQTGDDIGGDCESATQCRAALDLDRLERRLSAHAAAGTRVEVAVQPRVVENEPRTQRHVDDVERLFLVLVRAMGDVDDVVAAADDSLAVKEAGCEVEIVARGAHRHGDVLADGSVTLLPDQPDLQWLLRRQHILGLGAFVQPDAADVVLDDMPGGRPKDQLRPRLTEMRPK